MANVTLHNLFKSYDGQTNVVDGIDLDIADGEFVVLVGPSGCGKSTTLRMIAGLEDVTAGTISIGGRVVNDVEPKNRDIAMVFQSYALYPHMTVYKNMAFALQLRKTPKAEIDRRVRDAANKLGITDYLDRKPKALSGGQRQRVALGRAIVRDPACFLFDEPLSNLDAKLRAETRAELKQLHQQLQTTSVYVTHDQEEAMTLGDRVVVMSGGHIQQAGTPLEVYQRPANRFVAGFIGMPAMNMIEGVVEYASNGLRFTADGLTIPITGNLADAANQAIDRPLALGIRPEHFVTPDPARHGERPTVDVQVRVVEPLGAQMDVYGTLANGQRVLIRTEARPIQPETVEPFAVAIDKTHLFEEGVYGKNLSLQHADIPQPSPTPRTAATI
ncbi:MAG: ABC transporter ATP-binding protein [Phycisphaeraceae bacterium]